MIPKCPSSNSLCTTSLPSAELTALSYERDENEIFKLLLYSRTDFLINVNLCPRIPGESEKCSDV